MARLASALPISVLTDSYKATHYLQYPAAKEMVAVSAPAPGPTLSGVLRPAPPGR
jgi:hypothetical protein